MQFDRGGQGGVGLFCREMEKGRAGRGSVIDLSGDCNNYVPIYLP